MATTIAKAFDEFSDYITPTAEKMADVRARRDTVVGYLGGAFPSTATIQFQSASLIGSFGRNTASRPFDDIDIMAVLNVDSTLWATRYSGDSSDFLYRVRTALNNGTAIKKVGARGQAVRLFYTDGLSVDVAPVVKYTTTGYGIPDGSGHWLTTDPTIHASYLNQQNGKLSGDLKKVVRMAKKWNQAHSSLLTSFHIEMLVARTFASLGNNSRQALQVFFHHNQNNLSVSDPAGYSGDLSSYLDSNRRAEVNERFGKANERAVLALAAEDRGDVAEAIRLWRIVLGSDFPAYG
jgi:hypothetical protein